MNAEPHIAWISNSLPPYRLHFFNRLIAEVPNVILHTGFTHGASNAPWKQAYPAHIRPRAFHHGESIPPTHAATFVQDVRKGKRIIKWLESIRPCAVIIGGYSDPALMLTMAWCARKAVPFFVVADSNALVSPAMGLKSIAKRCVLQRIIKHTAGFMVCGSAGMQYFHRYGAADSQLFIVPYDADFALFRNPLPADVVRAQMKYHLDPRRRRMVYSGRLVNVKRVELLIDAYVKLASYRPQWDLLIVGDGPLRSCLESRLPSDLANRVTWVGFVDSPSDIAALYHNCDALVLPSDNEPWGIVISEAASAGLAIVASDVVGAAVELVEDDVNGFHFKHGDPSSLITQLEKVTEPNSINRLKANSVDVFCRWRKNSDPILGFKQAVASVGILI